MDQYFHWDSNHIHLVKSNVCSALAHRPKVVCTSEPTLQQQNGHIRQDLLRYNFPHGP